MTTRSRSLAAESLVQRLAKPLPPLAELAAELGILLGAHAPAPDDARAVRVALSRARGVNERDRASLDVLLAVLSGYERSRELDDEKRQAALTFPPQSTAARVLLVLAHGPHQPVEIAKALGRERDDGRVTRALRLLEQHELVEPADSADGRGRARALSQVGIAAARELRERNASPDLAVRDAVRSCVEVTIKWMRMVEGQDRVTRLELERDARAHGHFSEVLLNTFCHAGESAGLVDFDASGGAWLPRQRVNVWEDFFKRLNGRPDPFDDLERQVAGASIVVVTVGERMEPWRAFLGRRKSRIDPEPALLVQTDPTLRSGVLVFDDDTLAQSALAEFGLEGRRPRALFSFSTQAEMCPIDVTQIEGAGARARA